MMQKCSKLFSISKGYFYLSLCIVAIITLLFAFMGHEILGYLKFKSTLELSSTESPSPSLLNNSILLPKIFNNPETSFDTLLNQSRSPSEKDLFISAEEDREYLQSILDEIFPKGFKDLPEEIIVIDILRYVASRLLFKTNSGSATKILQDGFAICGGINISFYTLVRMAGIPARYVSIMGVGYFGSHAFTEVFYDDHWHLFDPTFGTFFYSNKTYNGQGYVPSFSNLLENQAETYFFFKATDKPWVGYFNKDISGLGVSGVGDNYLSDYYHFNFKKAYQSMFYRGFPVANDNLQIVSYPIIINFNSGNPLIMKIGKIDNDSSDILKLTANVDFSGQVGTFYIGGSGIYAVHTWFITVPSPGYVRIIYASAGDTFPDLITFPLSSVYLVDKLIDGNQIEYIIRIVDSSASLQFWVEENIFWVDMIEAEWLGENINSE